MRLYYGSFEDIEKWMRLVTMVRANFPGLETQKDLDEHRATVLKFMDKRQAVCVKEQNEILGVMLFSRSHNMICCLAVLPEYRRMGVASMLMEEALCNLDTTEEISVSTFRADDEKGIAPRSFYEKFGFTEGELTMEMNYPNQKYILHPIYRKQVISHYDFLVSEGNDPVHDEKPLRDYMDKWDGSSFMEQMRLDKSKSVLEIGVGTGRLAVRVAPLCGEFFGIDISPKTIKRATENLSELQNARLICADFLSHEFDRSFDVIYSSLTFMHIKDKQKAVDKVSKLLNESGRFVLSIDKNSDEYIELGTRKIKIYPDNADNISKCIRTSGLILKNRYDTEFATIFTAVKA